MQKLLIIDGSALLFQSFFGMPRKIINHKGQYIEAVICFTGILLKTIKALSPSQVLIVFDGENKLDRQEIDENYKANRVDYTNAEDKDNPFAQLEIIKSVLNYLNFKWIETENCEADDLIASVVNDYKNQFEIVISSADKDFYQLIDNNVSVFTYRGKVSKLWTKDEIYNKYGFDAKYFSTYKALTGDKSDNIKGVKGIGQVTATKLIAKYGNLDSIYQNIETIDEKLSNLLLENKTIVYNNYKIVELHSKTNLYALPNCEYTMPNINSTLILRQLDIM